MEGLMVLQTCKHSVNPLASHKKLDQIDQPKAATTTNEFAEDRSLQCYHEGLGSLRTAESMQTLRATCALAYSTA